MELGFGDLLDEVFGSDPEGWTVAGHGTELSPGWHSTWMEAYKVLVTRWIQQSPPLSGIVAERVVVEDADPQQFWYHSNHQSIAERSKAFVISFHSCYDADPQREQIKRHGNALSALGHVFIHFHSSKIRENTFRCEFLCHIHLRNMPDKHVQARACPHPSSELFARNMR